MYPQRWIITTTALLLVAQSCGAQGPAGPSVRTQNAEREPPRPKQLTAAAASGDDGRVRVDVAIREPVVAPGEAARIYATSKMLVDGPLRFPQGHHQPLAFLYLRTPAGQVIVHPDRGVSPKHCRALELHDYTNSFLFKKGIGGQVIAYDIPLVNASPEWLDPDTLEPVRPNLRGEGVYGAWVKHTIPKFEGIPADAWHGSVETGRVRFTVREVPVAARRGAATAEQVAHLEAYMKYMDAVLAGKDLSNSLTPPTTAELPAQLSLEDRVRWALERTENEGFARHAVSVLRKHQPKGKDEPYPAWWDNVCYLVRGRAYFDHGYAGEKALKIIGPYLDDYATVIVEKVERDLARPDHRPASLGAHHHVSLLLDFVATQPKTPIRQRLETLARRYARIPAGASAGDRHVREQLTVAWKVLYNLDVLRDGMPLAEARQLLGEPTTQMDDAVYWNYGTGSRRREVGVGGRVVRDGERETVVFTNRPEWVPEDRKPDGNTGWIKSKDGAVELQLRARTEPIAANDGFVLVALVRNSSGKPISVLKPFSGPFTGMPVGLHVAGPKGEVKYVGPVVQPRAHRRGDFVHLEPGQILEDQVELSAPLFATADAPGEYSVQLRYATSDVAQIARELRVDNPWSGAIETICTVKRTAEASAPAGAGTPFTVTKTSIRFDPKTCVRGQAQLAWGLGSVRVNVLGREGGRCVFDYTEEVEGGYSIYRCRVDAGGPAVTVSSTGSGIATSFALKDAHLLHQGNLHFDLQDGGAEWKQRGVAKTNYVNHYADLVTGTGAAAEAGHRVTIRYTVYADRKFDVSLPGAAGKTIYFRLGDSGTDAGLQEAVRGMKVGGRRTVLIREEVLPTTAKALGGIQTGTQVAICVELFDAK